MVEKTVSAVNIVHSQSASWKVAQYRTWPRSYLLMEKPYLADTTGTNHLIHSSHMKSFWKMFAACTTLWPSRLHFLYCLTLQKWTASSSSPCSRSKESRNGFYKLNTIKTYTTSSSTYLGPSSLEPNPRKIGGSSTMVASSS